MPHRISKIPKDKKPLGKTEASVEEALKKMLSTEEANRVNDTFLATVAHELRAPLGAILLWTKILEGKSATPGEIREGINAIKTSAEAMQKLIEELVEMPPMASGNLGPRPPAKTK